MEYSKEDLRIIQEAKKKAMSLLTFSDRTEFQLREKLKEGAFPPFAVEETVSYLYSFHYLDDNRYAESFIRTHANSKSKAEIAEELKKRGVAGEISANAIENSGISETETVKNLFIKKYGKKEIGSPEIFEKAVRYFGGKRFSFSAIKEGIRQAISELNKDEE